MGALRVVLYAEGSGETTGTFTTARAPGSRLGDDELGPGHVLVRRSIARTTSVPEAAILFEEPLRTRRGRLARGSDLLDPTTLAQLLTWGNRQLQPDLCVVLVDADGDYGRKNRLAHEVEQAVVPKIIALPTQEFEAWLIADHVAVTRALGSGPPPLGPPESLMPREAKDHLSRWTSASNRDGRQLRLTLARTCDLEVLRKICGAYEEFQRELTALPL